MKALVTGAAGFIGFHASRALLERGELVLGYDSLTPYYDVGLKRDRLAVLRDFPNFEFVEADLQDKATLATVVNRFAPELVLHLAAQAGVRYSLEAPEAYISSNTVGTYNLLEVLRDAPTPRHIMFASTSSVYGDNAELPFQESDQVSSPVSLYAATKLSGESMCHAYSHLFSLPITSLRFFTVYGPWGRPDMALFKFVRAMLAGDEVEVFGDGDMSRDFTYVDDLVDRILKLSCLPPRRTTEATEGFRAPYRVVNLGGGQPTRLMQFIDAIETSLEIESRRVLLPMQPGDVRATMADVSLQQQLIGDCSLTPLEEGVDEFVRWYREYYALELAKRSE